MAFGLVVLIVATIVGLNLLEKLLRRRSRAIVEEETTTAHKARVYTASDTGDEAMQESSDAGPRRRIIERLAWLSRRMDAHGMGRPCHKTVSEWLGEGGPSDDIDKLFAEACYSREPITSKESERFDELTGAMVVQRGENGDGAALPP
jgi:hypothetical protein